MVLNGRPVRREVFLEVEREVKGIAEAGGLGCTEFEVLAATAFEIFSREKVQVAVVEVGLGGRLDATNGLPERPLVAVVTKVGRDHEGLLGNGLAGIAREKAGIVKEGVEVVVDGTNDGEVLRVVEEVVKEVKGGKVVRTDSKVDGEGRVVIKTERWGEVTLETPLEGEYQKDNLACAVNALDIASKTFPQITLETVKEGLKQTQWPGRIQWLDLPMGRALLDGAHNPQAAIELAKHVDSNIRAKGKGVSWVLAATEGKDISEIFKILLRPGDFVLAVGFPDVDGMPWIKCVSPHDIAREAKTVLNDEYAAVGFEFADEETLGWAFEQDDKEVVIAGSLYLVGDVLRRFAGEDAA